MRCENIALTSCTCKGRWPPLLRQSRKPITCSSSNVAVSPAFQGRGFGRKLMAHAELVAGSTGYSEIRLYTNKLFVENVRFYSKLGYRIDREEEFKGGFAVHMSKPVRSREGCGWGPLAIPSRPSMQFVARKHVWGARVSCAMTKVRRSPRHAILHRPRG
jgi:hypothetical protein